MVLPLRVLALRELTVILLPVSVLTVIVLPLRVLALRELIARLLPVRVLTVVVLPLKELTVRVLPVIELTTMVDPWIPLVEILLDQDGALLVLAILIYPGGTGVPDAVTMIVLTRVR